MKLRYLPIPLAALTILASNIAIAEPAGVKIDIQCPRVSNLQNFGDYIAGVGAERISDQAPKEIYFRSENVNGLQIKLDDYDAAGTDYRSELGIVTCAYHRYKQLNPDDSPFEVAYQLTNAKGGRIIQKSANSITLEIPFGIKK